MQPTGNQATSGGSNTTMSSDSKFLYSRWTSTLDSNIQSISLGALRLDVVVGWGKNVGYYQTNPQNCTRTLRMTSYYQP